MPTFIIEGNATFLCVISENEDIDISLSYFIEPLDSSMAPWRPMDRSKLVSLVIENCPLTLGVGERVDLYKIATPGKPHWSLCTGTDIHSGVRTTLGQLHSP